MKTWKEYWDGISNAISFTIDTVLRGSCGGVDSDDIRQDIALDAWLLWSDGKEYTVSFWCQRSRWRTIDVLRRHRNSVTLEEAPEAEAPPSIKPHIYEEVVSYLGEEMASMMLRGLSITECAHAMGLSKATVSRRWNEARRKAMSSNMQIVEMKRGHYFVTLNDVKVATIRTERNPHQCGIEVTLDMGCRLDVVSDPTSSKNLLSVINTKWDAGEYTTQGRYVPCVSDSVTRASILGDTSERNEYGTERNEDYFPPVLVGVVRGYDFPPTLQEWQRMCGGSGMCLGGSGKPVTSRFGVGWNAKLLSALKRKGTQNAALLAMELGWNVEGLT